MANVLNENWEAFAISTSLDASPPNWIVHSQTGSGGATVENNATWSSKVARPANTNMWAGAVADMASQTAGFFQSRANASQQCLLYLFASGTFNAGDVFPIDGYVIQYQDGAPGVLFLRRGGGGGSLTTLASKSFTVSDVNDYKLKIEHDGGIGLKVFVDGVEELSASDATFSSGKGIILTFNTGDFDNLIYDDGVAGGGDFGHGRRGRR